MWDLPRPGLEPVSLALAGRFLTTAPPGKPINLYFLMANDVEHLNVLICQLSTSFSELYTLFICLSIFLIGLFGFLLLSFESSLSILDTSPLSDI